jgi:hypothetical protein
MFTRHVTQPQLSVQNILMPGVITSLPARKQKRISQIKKEIQALQEELARTLGVASPGKQP